ncbi:MAG: AIPR family protein [Ignavibacteria bacterium]|nr:AIPR family protein [Ignavibacteria bacterium]
MTTKICTAFLVQNVRTDLHTKINEDIEATYVGDPDHFWMFNNGVYITCSRAHISGDLFTLHSPSVINGGQTVASVFNSAKTSDAQVLIRICEVDVQRENNLLRNVILRTNTQNPVKPYNLVAHDRTMLNIARYLDRFKIYFERRESEWKNIDRSAYHEYEVVDIRSLTQWMATLTSTSNIGTARQSVSKLFDREVFNKIFSSYETDDYTSPAYTQLAVCVWVGKLVDSWIKSIPTAHKLKKKNSQVAKLIIFYSCLDACRKVRFDVERATDMLSGHQFGRNDLPASIKKALAELRDSIEKSASKHYPEEQLDILTKSKEAKELLTYAYAGKVATNLQQAIKRDGTAVR